MWDIGLQTAFVGSYVIKNQEENPSKKDFYSEIKNLTRFLTEWSTNTPNFIERIEQLFIDLYKNGFIQEFDVHLTRLWLKELHKIGYEFPDIPKKYTLVVRTFSGHLYRLNRW